MMDQYVTFDDLLKICSILLNLASLIFYIYYNHKIVMQITAMTRIKGNNRP